jgi:DNA-binding NarL/FixJ family response regulator
MEKNIFIIEADINMSLALEAKFRIEGMTVVTNNGLGKIEEIVRQLKLAEVDYIIFNIDLPQINGLALLEEIKSDQEISSIPIFIFTDENKENTKRQCQQLGVEYYFLKSESNIEEFVNKVEKIIANREKIKLK